MHPLETLQDANRIIGICPRCKTKPQVIYEPGVTFARCPCGESHAMPDFHPVEVARAFNSGILASLRRQLQKKAS